MNGRIIFVLTLEEKKFVEAIFQKFKICTFGEIHENTQ